MWVAMSDKTNVNAVSDQSGFSGTAEPDTKPGAQQVDQQPGTDELGHGGEGAAAAEELPSVPPLTPEEIAELRAKAKQAEEYYDRYLRALAELDNYRKRVIREREEAEKYKHEPLLKELLAVLDGLEMACAVQPSASNNSFEALKSGVAMISQQLKTILRQAGLEEIDAVGKSFDPRLHDAIEHRETTEVEDGIVLEQLRKGFKYRDRLLRPASVVVAKKPSEPKTQQ